MSGEWQQRAFCPCGWRSARRAARMAMARNLKPFGGFQTAYSAEAVTATEHALSSDSGHEREGGE